MKKMSMKKIFLFALSLVLSFAATTASAQDTGVNSPFSRYGIGLLSNQAQGFNSGMAGLAYGMRNGRELNFKNPASYSAIDSLTFLFDMGVSLQNGNFSTGKASTNARNASFEYLSMGFRINRGFGMSIGLMPVSNIGYNTSSEGTAFDGGITGDVTPTVTYTGSGGLREVYAGLGYAPVKPISFGVNVGYMWGVMNHVATNSYTDPNVQSLNRAYSSEVRTYKIDAGLQWAQRVGKNNSFVLGLSYGLGHKIPGSSYLFNQRILNSAVLAVDTLTAHNAWSIPHTFGGGLTWQYRNKLRVGVDYNQQLWSKANQPQLFTTPNGQNTYKATKDGYCDTKRYTIGMEYVNDPEGLKWADRVRYHAGFSYGNNYTKIMGSKAPNTYLATIGAAFPIINIYNNRTFINVSAQYERVKPQVAGQITENYFRLCLGITFNERWFMKWKVE